MRFIKHFLILSILFTPLLWHGEAHSDKEAFVVWDFNSGIKNELHGVYNQFEKEPSLSRLYFSADSQEGWGKSLKVSYDKKSEGHCGLWMHLFDSEGDTGEDIFFDATEYTHFSFWVKGSLGGEAFEIQFADADWFRKEDSSPIGSINDYLESGVTTEWQEVNIPLSKLTNFDLKTLATFVINFTKKGKGDIFIDNIIFKTDILQNATDYITKKEVIEPVMKKKRAMWVWRTEEYLKSEDKIRELFDFCVDKNVGILFLQVHGIFRTIDGEIQCRLKNEKKLRAFNRGAHSRGISVEVLDGHPESVLAKNHAKVLSHVQAVIDFNRESDPLERFDAIHYDNEPYLMSSFSVERRQILLDYLKLNEACVELIRSNESDLVFGVDVPFWFKDYGEVEDKEKSMLFEYKGKEKMLIEHVIDICDNVGIMDYRNFAGGADGIIRHGSFEIDYAAKTGKDIYIGVETFRYDEDKAIYVTFVPRDKIKTLMSEDKAILDFMRSRDIDGFNIKMEEDEKYMYFGLTYPLRDENNKKRKSEYKRALEKLYNLFKPHEANRDDFIFDGTFAVGANYSHKDVDNIKVKFGEEEIDGIRTTTFMLDKITFAGFSEEDFERELKQVEEAFSEYPSFKGFAIHYYRTYKKLAT